MEIVKEKLLELEGVTAMGGALPTLLLENALA